MPIDKLKKGIVVNKYVNRPMYNSSDWGETELYRIFNQQRGDARNYFLNQIKPRLDRSYKLYIAWPGDRAREIQRWQSNIFVPYVQGVVETMVPRIVDARPDFGVQGRNPASELKAKKLEGLCDYFWEKAEMDTKVELLVRSAMVFGTGFLQAYWRKDVRDLQFLRSNDLTKKLEWKNEERTFYDAPIADWVDNYNLWYDWRNVEGKEKRFWFVRKVLTEAEIMRRYPMADPAKMALIRPGGDLSDYATVRRDVKATNMNISRGQALFADINYTTVGAGTAYQYDTYNDMFEVFEWWRPLDDRYAVFVNEVPILKGGEMPNPYDFKETPFITVPYLKVPGEFEGYGIPMILESPQIMLNTIKNQRLDATTLNIHKMWIVNPLANIDKGELVTRPFGIIYSTDPQGVREVQFTDVKQSAFQEETLLKNDMRYASGVDDFSMGAEGAASSATEVRHLRESTIERVRLFVNHLGDGFATLQRYWIEMTRQFFTEDMIIRIVGQDGKIDFPLIEKDDVMGEFDFKASVLPSIAGQNEIKKKQDMDLLQLLMQLPFIDPQKLISKVLFDWDWDAESIMKDPSQMQAGPPGMPGAPGQPPGAPPGMPASAAPPGAPTAAPAPASPPMTAMPQPGGQGGPRDVQSNPKNKMNPEVVKEALRMLSQGAKQPGQIGGPSSFGELGSPITLDQQVAAMPPTAPGIPASEPGTPTFANANQTGPVINPRGMNRTGKVNTDVATGNNASPESSLLSRAFNLQGKKK